MKGLIIIITFLGFIFGTTALFCAIGNHKLGHAIKEEMISAILSYLIFFIGLILNFYN